MHLTSPNYFQLEAFMKMLISILIFLSLTLSTKAQRQVSYGYIEIEKSEYDSCTKIEHLVSNHQIEKQSGKITIPISNKVSKILSDNNSGKNFQKFDYIGDIKNTKLTLIKRTDYYGETFYLINRSTGIVDTLIGKPVFGQNRRDFICINNPRPDEKQQIQICEIKNGSVITRVFIRCKTDTLFEDISCVLRNSILAKDKNGKYWKLNFKIDDE